MPITYEWRCHATYLDNSIYINFTVDILGRGFVLSGVPRKPSGELPRMLPLRTPECGQGYRQLLPFLLSKPF